MRRTDARKGWEIGWETAWEERIGGKDEMKGHKERMGGKNGKDGKESKSNIKRDGSMINRLVLQSCEWMEKKLIKNDK
jgi:hypothetical protein